MIILRNNSCRKNCINRCQIISFWVEEVEVRDNSIIFQSEAAVPVFSSNTLTKARHVNFPQKNSLKNIDVVYKLFKMD